MHGHLCPLTASRRLSIARPDDHPYCPRMNGLALQPAWTPRQRVLAAVTPVGPRLLLAGSLITPSAADDFSPDSKDATKITRKEIAR